jgi:hypothetical protein
MVIVALVWYRRQSTESFWNQSIIIEPKPYSSTNTTTTTVGSPLKLASTRPTSIVTIRGRSPFPLFSATIIPTPRTALSTRTSCEPPALVINRIVSQSILFRSRSALVNSVVLRSASSRPSAGATASTSLCRPIDASEHLTIVIHSINHDQSSITSISVIIYYTIDTITTTILTLVIAASNATIRIERIE